MERVKEQELLRYVVATLGEDGKVFYLQSLHWGKYQMVDRIEYATKLIGKKVARDFYMMARQDLGPNVELVILPLIITYELIKEVEDGDDVGKIDCLQ